MIRLLPVTLLLFAALAAPAAAHKPTVGIGDQHPQMFSDPAFRALGVTHSRYLVSWDWFRKRSTIAQTDFWVNNAHRAGIEPLIVFTRNWRPNGQFRLPPMKLYRKGFRLFRARYPWVRDFGAWNEANHTAQPTAHKPAAAARYYLALHKACRRCRIIAADVLDTPHMVQWLRAFKRKAPGARLWGLHNYKDANDRKPTTRVMLRAVRGKIWLTETGGMLRLKPHAGSHGDGRRSTPAKQARAVTRAYRIARSSRRIQRMYYYEWKKQPSNRWDSAFLNANGTARPAYRALKRVLGI